jgi:CBS domain-containing protein
MALPLPALPLEAPAYSAAALMAERGCSEVVLLDNGKVAGVIDEQHLFEFSNLNIGELSHRLRSSGTVGEWVKVSRSIAQYTRKLIEQGLAATRITQLVSDLSDQLAAHIINSEFSQLQLPPGTRWAWLVFGSEGRHEQTLLTDQDNGLAFTLPENSDREAIRAVFVAASKRINETLAECGFSLCNGGIMAGNPACCLAADEWLQKFRKWIAQPEPEAILNCTIFFDFRFLAGHPELATAMHLELATLASQNRRFHLLLAESAMQRTPPIGFFRDFRTDDEGMIDLKLGAVTIFVDAARLYALVNGFKECATDIRLELLSSLGKLEQSCTIAWRKAFAFVQTLRLRAQNEALSAGRPTSNRINPYELNELDRRFLLESLRQAAKLQKRMQTDFAIQ